LPAETAELFLMRLKRSERDLFGPLEWLYGADPGYGTLRQDLLKALISLQKARPPALPCAALILPAIWNPTGFNAPIWPAVSFTLTA